MVKEIPSTGKAMVLVGALASIKLAEKRFGTMSMHSVGFPFVT